MLNHWNCEQCDRYNDILSNICWNCSNSKPSFVTIDYQGRIELQRGIYLSHGILASIHLKAGDIKLTDRELHFKKFFDASYAKAIDINKMSIDEITAWINELEVIAFEAKASIQGAGQAREERTSKLSKSERDKLVTNPDLGVSDAINSVKKRADRKSKADKVLDTLKAMGVDSSFINSTAMPAIKVDESKQSYANQMLKDGMKFNKEHKDEIITFNGTPEPIDTCEKCGQDYKKSEKDLHKCPPRVEERKKDEPFNPFG
jgi:hypothetical protein